MSLKRKTCESISARGTIMKKTYHRWQDVRPKTLAPQQLEAIDRAVEEDLLALDLQAIRELLGKTQIEEADATYMTQSEVSRLERCPDGRLSTLTRYLKPWGEKWKSLRPLETIVYAYEQQGRGSTISRGKNMFSLSGRVRELFQWCSADLVRLFSHPFEGRTLKLTI